MSVRLSSLRLLSLVALGTLLAGCGGSREVTAPGMSGVWAGEGRQWNSGDRTAEPDDRWLVRVTVAEDAMGTPSASIDYPELGCGGRLAYVGPNTALDAQPGDRVFREEITYGTDRCADGGTVMLRPSRNSLIFAWAMDGRPTVAAARLVRQE